jgi:DNA (cytosine-5)-methyltransferase 1
MIKVGSDFSGVGAFNQALIRLGIEYDEVFACDMDKYARQTFIHNYGEPKYYPTNVYDREIPSEPLDIYMTSPPCQAFSLAGKRLGKEDKRGILFFNSLEFIQINKPRYFIFENVKGLLSDDNGKTFSEWVNLLGGKSVNGNPVIFPYEDAVPYHLHWQVLNAKHHGVPQNRERVFLVGIRDDKDFRFPIEEHLTKRLKDVLESDVDSKYFLSEKGIEHILAKEGVYTGINESPIRCLTTRYSASLAGTFIKIKSATSKGYEEATEGDSINFSVPSSETRRGRVGKGVAQTLDTGCQKGVMIGAFRGRNTDNPSDITTGSPTEQRLEINSQGTSNTITSVQKDNVVILGYTRDSKKSVGNTDQFVLQDNYRIRRLTPRECFRLMDFPDTFTWPVSDSQAYKQAGNSIVVNVLYKILKNLLY